MSISSVAKKVERRGEISIAMATDEIMQNQGWLVIVFLANKLIQSAFELENFLAFVTSNHFAEEH